MYDSDREFYAQGFYVEENNGYDEFEPLDCYGEGMWGATHLKYFNKKTRKWEDL